MLRIWREGGEQGLSKCIVKRQVDSQFSAIFNMQNFNYSMYRSPSGPRTKGCVQLNMNLVATSKVSIYFDTPQPCQVYYQIFCTGLGVIFLVSHVDFRSSFFNYCC